MLIRSKWALHAVWRACLNLCHLLTVLLRTVPVVAPIHAAPPLNPPHPQVGEQLATGLCYTLEVSMCSGLITGSREEPPGSLAATPPELATEATYMEYGKQLAMAIGDFYLPERDRGVRNR